MCCRCAVDQGACHFKIRGLACGRLANFFGVALVYKSFRASDSVRQQSRCVALHHVEQKRSRKHACVAGKCGGGSEKRMSEYGRSYIHCNRC